MKLFFIKIQVVLFVAGCLCTMACVDKTTKASDSFLTLQEVREDFYQLTDKIEAPTVNFELPGYSIDEKEYYRPDYEIYSSLEDRLNGNNLLLSKALEILN